jgi:hypothetical protein
VVFGKMEGTEGQSAQMAARAYDDFHICLHDSLKVDMKQLRKLVADGLRKLPAGPKPSPRSGLLPNCRLLMIVEWSDTWALCFDKHERKSKYFRYLSRSP